MITINLPPNLESSLLEAVGRGRFVSVDEAIAEAVGLLMRVAKQPTDAPEARMEEWLRKMAAEGRITLPDRSLDVDDDDDEPIEIEGEPLSETIIRERR